MVDDEPLPEGDLVDVDSKLDGELVGDCRLNVEETDGEADAE